MSNQPIILRPGDAAVRVGQVQEQLNVVGEYGLEVDNVFGPATEASVRDFQRHAGLPVTGIVDAPTWRRLFDGTPFFDVPSFVSEPARRRSGSPGIGPSGAATWRAQYSVLVNLTKRTLTLVQNEIQVRTYPVAIGKPSTPTPTGRFTIINKAYQPGGPFGTRWLGLTESGIGIHGTSAPQSIGLEVSSGCIRMHNEDVEAIWDLLSVGDPVTIVVDDRR